MRLGMVLLALSLGQAALGDATLRFVETRHGERLAHVLYIQGDKVRLEGEGDPLVTLFDARQKRLILLDTASRTYRTIDVAEMRRQMEAIAAELRAALQGLPPEARRALEAQRPPAVRARPGGRRSAGGFTCKVWYLYRDKTFFQEVCLADARGVGIGEEDYRTFVGIATFLRELAQQAASLADRIQVAAADLEGIPVQVKDLERGSRFELVAASTSPLDGSLFRIPQGFTPLTP